MSYVILGDCVSDTVCVDVCPVDCIHPTPGEPDFATAEMLYVDPESCIDCDACAAACPVDAIRAASALAPAQAGYAELNAEYSRSRGE